MIGMDVRLLIMFAGVGGAERRRLTAMLKCQIHILTDWECYLRTELDQSRIREKNKLEFRS